MTAGERENHLLQQSGRDQPSLLRRAVSSPTLTVGRILRSLGLGGALGMACGAIVHHRWPSLFPDAQIASYVGAGVGVLLSRLLDALVEWILSPIGKIVWLWLRILNFITLRRAGLIRADVANQLIERAVIELGAVDPEAVWRRLTRKGVSGSKSPALPPVLPSPSKAEAGSEGLVLTVHTAGPKRADSAKEPAAKVLSRGKRKSPSEGDSVAVSPVLVPARVSGEDAPDSVAAELEAAEAEAEKAAGLLGSSKIASRS